MLCVLCELCGEFKLSSDKLLKETIGVFGMTCMHCHKRVTDAISKVNGVKSVDVSLANKSATIDFDEGATNLDAINKAVIDAGYEVGEKTISKQESKVQPSAKICPVVIKDDKETVQKPAAKQKSGADTTISLKISGMTCAACAANIEKVTLKLEGVISSTVNVSIEKASITYDPSLVSQKAIEEAIKSIGYGVVKDKLTFDIGGMTCAACAQNIEKVLKKGVPVKWIINGKELTGCNNAIIVPSLGLEFKIKKGEQIIEFTPEKAGMIRRSCWMGMIRGSFIVK